MIAGLKLDKNLGATSVECRLDSQLVVGQLDGNFQTKDDQLLCYYHKTKESIKQFQTIEIQHVPIEENARANVLSKLASGKEKGQLSSVIRKIMMKPSIECMSDFEISDHPDCRKEIREFIQRQKEGSSVRVTEAKKIAHYLFIGGDLYKWGFSASLLKCVFPKEVEYVMRELHEGACGMHIR